MNNHNIIFTLLLIFYFNSCFSQVKHNLNGVIEPSEQEVKEWSIPEAGEIVLGNGRFQEKSHDAQLMSRLNRKIIKSNVQSSHLRSSTDLILTNLFPPPGNQGKLGSCTAWSLCYALKTYQEAQDHRYHIYKKSGELDTSKVFSPSYLFNNSISNTDQCSKGIKLTTALNKLMEIGTLPYNYYDNVDSCYIIHPIDLKDLSKKNRILQYYTMCKSHLGLYKNVDNEKVKKYIASGIPIVFAINLDDKWRDNGEFATNSILGDHIWKDFSSFSGNHAMVCVGYDDTIRAFKVLNSFGDNWGNKGYIWIDYLLFKKYVTEAYYVQDFDNYYDETYSTVIRKRNALNEKKDSTSLYASGYLFEGDSVTINNEYSLTFQDLNLRNKDLIFKIAKVSPGENNIATVLVKSENDGFDFYYENKLFSIYVDKIKNVPFKKIDRANIKFSVIKLNNGL